MTKWKRFKKFVKENPWEAGCYVLAGCLALQTLNVLGVLKVANRQGEIIDDANQMMEWIAQAIEKGWELALTEDGIIDIIPTEDSQKLHVL